MEVARCRRARAAYASWRLVPAPKRAELLYRAAQILAERKEDYARDMTREMGKILDETRGDVQEAIDMSYLMAGEGRRMYGQTVPSELRDKFAMSMRQPIGVCGLITAWNFPIAVPSWKILPALVCGNTIVFKPAEEAPQSAVNFVQALADAGVPAGVLNLVLGDGPAQARLSSSHPDVQVVSFTGSTEVGRLRQPGVRAVVQEGPSRDGRQERHPRDGGRGTGAGGRGRALGRLRDDGTAMHRGEPRGGAREGVQGVRRGVRGAREAALRVGDGLKPDDPDGAQRQLAQLERVMSYVKIGQEEGATAGDRRTPPVVARTRSAGYFHEPTIFADVAPTMRIAREEIFGPVVSVVPCRSLDEGIAIANDVAYGLSASIYTQDINKAFAAMRDVYTGIFYVNAPTIGAEVHLPFGGTKATGNGHREAGTAALDVFSEWKSVYVDFSGKLQRAQIDAVRDLEGPC